MTSTEIGAALGISARTVDQYFGEACGRLRVRNRIQAVAKSMALGLIS
jgi:DNA-binding CsgD family transcriptional regulator